MTNEQAIKEFEERIELGERCYKNDCPEYIEAMKMAIDALKCVNSAAFKDGWNAAIAKICDIAEEMKKGKNNDN